MKNVLSYYYNLHPDIIHHLDNKYFFKYMNNLYVLEPYNRPINDMECLYKVNKQMIKKNIMIHEIISNVENNILTYINNIPYILMEVFINKDVRINLADICHINNNSVDIECDMILKRYDWVTLWETKNDYFEAQINEIGKKYPDLSNVLNYYIGLSENAILYVRNALELNDYVAKVVCHKRIDYNDTLYELYNPIELIYDYRVRDVCEYIKSSFFNGINAYNIVEEYFQNNYLSYKEALLFYGRLIYPSYFFDLYDEIVNNNLKEDEIEYVILKSKDYEIFLANVYLYLSKLYNRYIPSIDWIIKRSYI